MLVSPGATSRCSANTSPVTGSVIVIILSVLMTATPAFIQRFTAALPAKQAALEYH
jgi:hypothetical protein